MLFLLSLLTSCDLCHITYGVNTADGVGVGGVYVAVEDEGCVKALRGKSNVIVIQHEAVN